MLFRSCLGGVREIFSVKHYLDARRIFFVGAEVRWKEVYYHDVYEIYTPAPGPQPAHYGYTLKNTVVGGAVWCGFRLKLSGNDRWRLEPSVGLGLKSRSATAHGVPAAPLYGGSASSFGLENNGMVSVSPRESVQGAPYLPASVRLIYVL